jgi:hypothetical protein
MSFFESNPNTKNLNKTIPVISGLLLALSSCSNLVQAGGGVESYNATKSPQYKVVNADKSNLEQSTMYGTMQHGKPDSYQVYKTEIAQSKVEEVRLNLQTGTLDASEQRKLSKEVANLITVTTVICNQICQQQNPNVPPVTTIEQVNKIESMANDYHLQKKEINKETTTKTIPVGRTWQEYNLNSSNTHANGNLDNQIVTRTIEPYNKEQYQQALKEIRKEYEKDPKNFEERLNEEYQLLVRPNFFTQVLFSKANAEKAGVPQPVNIDLKNIGGEKEETGDTRGNIGVRGNFKTVPVKISK